MRNALWIFCIASLLALLPACRNGESPADADSLPKARIVTVHSDAVADRNQYGKTFWIVATHKNEFNADCRTALINGLKHLGFSEASSRGRADFIVEYSYSWRDGRRRDTTVNMKFIRNNGKRDVLWRAVSKCSSGRVEIRGFLPGLTAGALLFVGRSTHSRTRLSNYPDMVRAVEGK